MCPLCKAVRLSVDTNFLRNADIGSFWKAKTAGYIALKYRMHKKKFGSETLRENRLNCARCPSRSRTCIIKRIQGRTRKRRRGGKGTNFSLQRKRFDPHFAFSLSPNALYSRKISLNEIPAGWYNSRRSVAAWALYSQRRCKCRQARCPGTVPTM